MSFIEAAKRYVGFSSADAAALLRMREFADPEFSAIADVFYEHVSRDPVALALFADEAQIHRMKRSLVVWMREGLTGPHDEGYYRRRARVGRVHVEINMPQRFMLVAMNVVRREFHRVATSCCADAAQLSETRDAVDRLLDIELAIMLESYKEDSDDRLRRQERLASLGLLAGTIGHELRNPLSVIESSAFLVRRRLQKTAPDDDGAIRHLNKIERQVAKVSTMISELLEMTRSRKADQSLSDLASVVGETLSELEPKRAAKGVEVTTALEDGLLLWAESSLIVRALANVVGNAIEAVEPTVGRVRVEAVSLDGGVLLTVTDNGTGFDPAVIAHAFEPLVTGKAAGVGLGLALVKNVCKRHDATASVANHDEGGAIVTLWFPPAPRARV